MAGVIVISRTVSILTVESCMDLAGVLSRTARRIGLGAWGRERSGTLIPTITRNNGMARVMNRR